MKLGGVFGYSDVGKTTLVQTLSDKKTNKYKIEEKRGITLKVGYTEYVYNDQKIYFLDHPGHAAMSAQSIRNIDILDFALYVIDCGAVRNDPALLKSVLNHHNTYIKIFKQYKIQVGLVFNKIDLCDTDQMSVLYDEFHKNYNEYVFVKATCALDKRTISDLQESISSLKQVPRENLAKNGVIGRVIKSFDLNPQGVFLNQYKGAVLGVYYYKNIKNIDKEKTYYINDNVKKKWERIKIKTIRGEEKNVSKIGSCETFCDGYYYKNDQKKMCYLIEQEHVNDYVLKDKIQILFKKKSMSMQKNDSILLIHNGQTCSGIVKKTGKNRAQIQINDRFLLCFPDEPVLIFIYRQNENMIFQSISHLV